MGLVQSRDKSVGKCIVVCLAQTRNKECHCVQRKWGVPDTESVGEDLNGGSCAKYRAEIEVAGDGAVG